MYMLCTFYEATWHYYFLIILEPFALKSAGIYLSQVCWLKAFIIHNYCKLKRVDAYIHGSTELQ